MTIQIASTVRRLNELIESFDRKTEFTFDQETDPYVLQKLIERALGPSMAKRFWLLYHTLNLAPAGQTPEIQTAGRSGASAVKDAPGTQS